MLINVLHPQTINVQSEGLAAIKNNDLPTARDAALIDAQRTAIQKSVGNFVDVEAMTFNGDLLASSVYLKAQGFVKSYKVISESQKDGIYHVRIDAQVRQGDLQAKVRKAIERESIVVLVDREEASAGLKKELAFAGYKVIDGKGGRYKRQIQKINRGDLKTIQAFGLKFLSTILITGRIAYVTAVPCPFRVRILDFSIGR